MKTYDELNAIAESLVKTRIKGPRKGIPDEPAYLHSFRVMELVIAVYAEGWNADLFLGALLHDVVEDGAVTLSELEGLGFSKRTIELVSLCTHPMDIQDSIERWVLMVARLIEANDSDAWRIKLADLTDNLKQCEKLPEKKKNFMLWLKAPLMLTLTKKHKGLHAQMHWLIEELNLHRSHG